MLPIAERSQPRDNCVNRVQGWGGLEPTPISWQENQGNVNIALEDESVKSWSTTWITMEEQRTRTSSAKIYDATQLKHFLRLDATHNMASSRCVYQQNCRYMRFKIKSHPDARNVSLETRWKQKTRPNADEIRLRLAAFQTEAATERTKCFTGDASWNRNACIRSWKVITAKCVWK